MLGTLPGHEAAHPTYPWFGVLWLTGVDYFSTLGYQPAIAFLAAGVLSPVATLLLVAVTLLGAVPVYAAVAQRSYAGQGSIAMLERLLSGWKGKLAVLTLLGFAATDFVITMTLSAADAAHHAVENPILHPWLHGHQLLVTCALLILLAAVFVFGFREAIGVASLVAVPYVALNLIIIARGALEIARHPELLRTFRLALSARGDTVAILFASALIFPKLALGMSGFETGVSLMPIVRGAPDDAVPPVGRIRATRRMLLTAAGMMSVLLVGSSLVTSVLIPAHEFQPGGEAAGRALALLAHRLLGGAFGTAYDLSSIVILWFAGASAMAAMLTLIPRYLPRFGMAPAWVEHTRPLVLAVLTIDLAVTIGFRASVEAQAGAYATGVLVLMLSAAVAVAIATWREARAVAVSRGRVPVASLYFSVIAAVLAFTLVDNVIARSDGLVIAGLFIVATIVLSAASRFRRSTELRVTAATFVDDASRELWTSLLGKKVNLVPVASTDPGWLEQKRERVLSEFDARGPIAFQHVELADDRSEFNATVIIRVTPFRDAYLIEVRGAAAIANNIAWVSEQLDPIAIYLDLSLENPFRQSLKYLLWGEGEIGVMVHEVLVRHWHSTPEDDVRPTIFLVSR